MNIFLSAFLFNPLLALQICIFGSTVKSMRIGRIKIVTTRKDAEPEAVGVGLPSEGFTRDVMRRVNVILRERVKTALRRCLKDVPPESENQQSTP